MLALQLAAGNRAVTALLDPLSTAQRDTALDTPTPSRLWYEVNDSITKLVSDIGTLNVRLNSPTRSEWVHNLNAIWAQVANGQPTDIQLQTYRAQVATLKAEIVAENTQAHASFDTDSASYHAERTSLLSENYKWTKNALRILDERFAETSHAVQVAGNYLTFDDLISLEHTLKNQTHRESAKLRYAQDQDGPSAGSTSALGAGLGAIITYEGKTLVRLGTEQFYVSGVPPKGTWVPKGGTTSVAFMYRKGNPKKMYRLDFDKIKMGPQQGQMGWEHNQEGVAKVLQLTVTNHQPAGGWGRALGTAARIYKWGGRALFVAGLVGSALEVYYAENKKRAIAKVAGGLGGAWAGAEGGALLGAKIGRLFSPLGAGIGAAIGGLIGGGLGAWGGSEATGYVWDRVIEPVDDEDDWIVLGEHQVEPTTAASGTGD